MVDRLMFYEEQDIYEYIEEKEAEIESLTAANERLRAALQHAIDECEFSYLQNMWEQVLEETK